MEKSYLALLFHPKMKLVSSLTHQTSFFLLLNTKEDILKNVGN